MSTVSCFVCTLNVSIEDYSRHLKEEHPNQDSYECNITEKCKRKFSVKKNFMQHIKVHLKQNDDSIPSDIEVTTSGLTNDSGNESTAMTVLPTDQSLQTCNLENDNNGTNNCQFINDLFRMTQKLYAHPKIPRSCTTEATSTLFSILEKMSAIVPKKCDRTFFDIFDFTPKEAEFLKSEYLFNKVQTQRFPFLNSEKITLLVTDELKLKNDNTLEKREIDFNFRIFSLKELLSYLFNNTNYLENVEKVLGEMKNLKNVKYFMQSDYWKSIIPQDIENGDLYLPLFIYGDDFEPNNPLGSHSSIQKIGGIYGSLMCLPEFESSKLFNIFLLMLYFSEDRKLFGNKSMFSNLVLKLSKLYNDGIILQNNSQYKKVKVIMCFILGDNLGLNQLLGLVESFSASHYCRFCVLNKDECRVEIFENTEKLRNLENYKKAVELKNPKETGIKEDSIFNQIPNFHLTTNLSVDRMHDIDEGVAKYDAYFLIKVFVTRKFFTLEDLNLKMGIFNYSPRYSKNRPPLIDIDSKGSDFKLRFSAEECHIFILYFAFLIGEYIPKDCPEWQLYIKLRQIIKFVYADILPFKVGEILNQYVADHNKLYTSLTQKHLTPKFHNLIHYGRIQDKIGLIKFTNCSRYESFHKPLKQYAYNCQNRINLLSSLVIKYQMQMCETLNHYNELSNVPIFKKKSGNISSYQEIFKYCQHINNNKQILTVKYTEYNGLRFENSMVICISESDFVTPNEMKFALIEKIFVIDEEIFFGIQNFNVLEFNMHYFAFSVQNNNKYDLFPVNNLIILKSSIIHVIEGKKLINWF
jgi:hypothetical protein